MTINRSELPIITPQEMTPTLRLLLAFIEQQQQTIEQLQHQVQQQHAEIRALKDEVARLQKRPVKPRIRPSTLPRDDEKTDNEDNDDAGQFNVLLQRPDIPLHNNLSEGDIREYVIKRKISGSTRSENGRRCRDTFASLKKTCKKQGVSFWEFVCDRLRQQRLVPYLPDLLAGKASLLKTL